MFPRAHFLSCVILLIILHPFFGYWSLAVFIGGFFIDVDHYLWNIIEKRNFNILKGYREISIESKKRMEKYRNAKKPVYLNLDMMHIFHVWEFWVLMFLLSFINKFFFIIFLGMVLHLSLDFYDMFKIQIYGCRAISFLGWLKRHGLRKQQE